MLRVLCRTRTRCVCYILLPELPVYILIQDLLAGINHTKHGNHIASQHRKKAGFFGSILGSTGLSSHSSFIRSMTDVERHAELVFAESLFEKVGFLGFDAMGFSSPIISFSWHYISSKLDIQPKYEHRRPTIFRLYRPETLHTILSTYTYLII